MFKRLILISIVFLMQLGATAQSNFFEVAETKPFKDSKRNTYLEAVFTVSNNNIVAVRSAKRKLLISNFNDQYSIDSDIELELERKEEYLGSNIDDTSIKIFTILKIDKRTRELYCHNYDLDSKTVKKSLLYTTKRDEKRISKYGILGGRKHSQNFRGSLNGDYVAFAVDNINAKSNSYAIRVFDRNLQEVYSTSYYSEIEKHFAFDDFIVTDEAEVICVGKLYKQGKRDKKKGKANYEYVIHKVSEGGTTSNTIDLGENFVQELRFAQTESQLRLMGFYSEKNSWAMKGALSYNFTGTDISEISLVQKPFPESIYKDIFREKRAERLKDKEKELSNYYLDHALVDEAGNSYLLAEQFYISTTTTGGVNGAIMTQTQYHYDNILVIKFDNQGNIQWGRSILKVDSQPSYNAFVVENKLHVFLNASKNIGEKADGRKKLKRGLFSSTALYDVVFDIETGDQTYEKIQENKGKTVYRPYLGTYDYDKFVMANLSKSKKQFLILTQK